MQESDNESNSDSKSEPEPEVQIYSGPQVDENGWTDLHLAAIDDNKTKVVDFLKKWPNYVDQKDIYGSTALHLASRWGHTSCLVELIQQGKANVNTTNNIGWTPLHCATWEGETENVILLLKIKPNNTVNSQTQLGWTPLHFAARWGHYVIAQVLIENGAKNDIKDSEGLSPGHQAAMMGRTKVLKLLNDKLLLNIYDRTNEGKTIIDFAFTNKNTLDFCIKMDDKYGMSFLQHVAVYDHEKLFKDLLKYYSKKSDVVQHMTSRHSFLIKQCRNTDHNYE